MDGPDFIHRGQCEMVSEESVSVFNSRDQAIFGLPWHCRSLSEKVIQSSSLFTFLVTLRQGLTTSPRRFVDSPCALPLFLFFSGGGRGTVERERERKREREREMAEKQHRCQNMQLQAR